MTKRNLKKQLFPVAAFAVVGLLAALLAGCLPAIGPLAETEKENRNLPAGVGRVIFSFGGSARSRSVSTDFSDLDRENWTYFAVVRDANGNTVGDPVPVSPGTFFEMELPDGPYTLVTTATKEGEVVARGEYFFEVENGQTQNVPIYVMPVQTGAGTFGWDVKVPLENEGDISQLKITLNPEGDGTPQEITLGGGIPDGDFIRYAGTWAHRPAKNYTLRVVLTTGVKTYEWEELNVSIYGGLTTTFTKDLYWGGRRSLTGTIVHDSPVNTVVVAAFSDAALTGKIGEDPDAGSYHGFDGQNHIYQWELVIPGVQEVWFGAQFGPAAAFEPVGYLADIPEEGRTNIELPMMAAVTFNSGGGEPKPPAQSVVYGGKATEPAGVTKEYYDLEGWYREAAMINKWDFAAHTVTGNITLYARWTPHLYNVTFDSAGGSSAETQYVAYNGLVTEPAGVTKTGYLLEGWYWGVEGLEIKWDFAIQPVWFDLVLYAKWTERYYKVDFVTNGGSPAPASQNIAYNQHAAAPPEITRPGFVFDGWYEDQECTRPWDFAVNTVTNSTTLYAGWNQSGGVSCDFSGPRNEDIILSGGQTISWLANTPVTFTVNDSFTAIRWYIDGTLKAGETGASLTRLARDFSLAVHHVTADVQIGGLWYSKTVTFTVVVQ